MFPKHTNASTLIQLIFCSPTARDRDDRLRLIKDRQNEERQKKLEELKAQALAAQKYREQKEEERKRRIEEMRLKENDKRQQVSARSDSPKRALSCPPCNHKFDDLFFFFL